MLDVSPGFLWDFYGYFLPRFKEKKKDTRGRKAIKKSGKEISTGLWNINLLENESLEPRGTEITQRKQAREISSFS